MNYKDLLSRLPFTGRAEQRKAVNTFLGILEGVSLDGVVDRAELEALKDWQEHYRRLSRRHPFNELLPAVDAAVSDGKLTDEEMEDLRWLCRQVTTDRYNDVITAGIQSLYGLLQGILADREIDDEELRQLSHWLEEHSLLRGSYPFDEIYSLVSAVLEDGSVSPEERELLKAFFAEFLEPDRTADPEELDRLKQQYSLQAVCARDPDIFIPGHRFAFTGPSDHMNRSGIESLIEELGGEYQNSVSGKTDYLVVGGCGNPCWGCAAYGRKIEKAVSLRKEGYELLIVREQDFWRAADNS